MRIDILTLFPEMCYAYLNESIIGRARKKGAITIECENIRDYTADKHNRVDDAPYAGTTGMVMQAQPIYDCFEALCETFGTRPHFIYLSPQGKTLTQQKAVELSKMEHIALLCGHYEGVDERVIESIVDEEISCGDYVLTGGELPALIVADCIARMIPGVLPNEEAYMNDSHFHSLLEAPQYTRPYEWQGRTVPDILLSGNHAAVAQWKREQSLARTAARRPDLLKMANLEESDKAFLAKIGYSFE
ncbi:MAG: tRNA (guanosine(37)-N1)-methyltransferase TrmD [Clostridia bacterium]|nr:tRNA (guanosine(37)-N1)-methyltransferase TrmD [Clostridia bacterium]